MKRNLITAGVGILLYAILAGVIVFSTMGCKTFKPVIVEGQPDECNDYYTTLAYYYSLNSKDGAFVGTVYNECKSARTEKRKAARELHCKGLYFGDGTVDKKQYEKYAQFLECCK